MTPAPTRVVVIDDEPVVRQYLDVALRDMGCTVELFDTQAAGLERCKTVNFDIVFVDKNLPDGTGMEICERLESADCKVGLITGYANLSSAVEAMRYGVAEYFIKPLDIEDLEARLLRMVEQLRLERHNRDLLKELQDKNRALEEIATRDPVTGLFNHSHFQERIIGEVARCKGKHSFAIVLLALDRFSEVNKKIGHARGDAVLKRVANMLSHKNQLKESTLVVSVQDLVGRLSGDVFAVLLPDVPRSIAALKLQLFRSLLKNSQLDPELPPQTASIGIAQYPDDGETPEALLKAAELALETAKRAGGDNLICYRAEEHSNKAMGVIGEVKRVHALGRSLSSRLFRFAYQPIVDAEGLKPVAYEALCRPTDEAFANVGELLEATARAGRFIELGEVLREIAIEPLSRLDDNCKLFLNLHPQELDGDLLFSDGYPLHRLAHRLVLEITETGAIEDYDHTRRKLSRLRERGYGIALDDLGAGYSGLNSLALLEPDYVKLDLALVRNIQSDSRAARLARHIREFCDAENIRTIAEGVETLAELQVLKEVGIRYMQGFLFAKPSDPFADVNRQALM